MKRNWTRRTAPDFPGAVCAWPGSKHDEYVHVLAEPAKEGDLIMLLARRREGLEPPPAPLGADDLPF